jgi:DNA-binding NarL/FixJ family response regulator
MTIGRIRVLVAGDIYLNRSLVRPFLEDDGYEIVGEPLTREEILPAVNAQHPDAVVMDDRLLSSRGNGKLVRKIRRAAPEAKMVVVSSAAGRPKDVPGVDAYLESGMSLAALSAILGGLFAAEDLARTAVGATAATATTGGRARAEHSSEPRGGVVRFVAAVGLPILVVWALIAIVTTGGGTPVPRSDTTDLGGDVVIDPRGVDRLDYAKASLDAMIDAIEARNYPLATSSARALMYRRATAIAGGYLTFDLDREIRLRLAGLTAAMPAGVTSTMQGILGNLFPELQSEQTSGSGAGVILGPVIGSGGSGATGTSTGGGGPSGGGDTTGGGGGNDGGDGDGVSVVALGPGGGREWGQSHKLTKGDGGPPPWATANGRVDQAGGHRGEPPGHDPEHGHGHSNGHAHANGYASHEDGDG